MNPNHPKRRSPVARLCTAIKGLLDPAPATFVAFLCLQPLTARPADVLGYSILKGQFLNQTDAEVLVLDPDFGFSILASVDLTDFDLLTAATLRLPEGESVEMDELGDYWAFLDSYPTLSSLEDDYVPGDYVVIFKTVNDGNFSCLVSLPETPLPPTPRLVNFADVQSVDSGKPLTLVWDFDAAPKRDDFVQVYVNLGHAEMFSTPDLGEPGALDGTSRSVTIPAGTLAPGGIHSLNLEITRLVSTSSDCYPDVEGAGGMFKSTAVDLITLTPPVLRLMSGPTNSVISIEVRAEPERTIVLQASDDLKGWNNMATNTAPSGTSVFKIPAGEQQRRFFRAWQP